MNKIYKTIGIILIMIFSFYYTDRIALMVQKNNPIMKEIEKVKKDVEVDAVNAIINEDRIIPGKNGLSINESKSFSIMKSFGTFNSYYLVYDQIKPNISLEDNKDKIIESGNPLNKNISLVIEENKELINYFKNNNIKFNILGKVENICYLKDSNIPSECKNKYLIYSDLILTNSNVYEIKSKLKNGSIIYIKNNTSIKTVDIILSQIKFKGLNIVDINELISEENTSL